MSTKTKTKWRLSELPTPEELVSLTNAGLLTKEEAREILISLETDEDRDKKSLQGEIKFLRELVEKLSNNRRADIIREITVIEKPYKLQPWFQPYYWYSNSGSNIYALNGATTTAQQTGLSTSANAVNTLALSGTTSGTMTANYNTAPTSFTSIKTF